MDLVRYVYYHFMTKTGLADEYRNEQFLPKSDILYNLEKLLLFINVNSKDRNKVSERLFLVTIFAVAYFKVNHQKLFTLL